MFKPKKKTDDSFGGRINDYTEYISEEIIMKMYHRKNILMRLDHI